MKPLTQSTDFKKAFDTVPHQRLAQKLHKYGISGNICKWIVNFLKDRKQRVLVNGKASEWAEVLSGVPQGSVLGPILFIIYINDLPECVSSCIKLFADDTKLYRVASSTQDCEKVQEDIDALQDWSKQWLLQFHPQKCKVLRVGKNHPDFTYTMNNIDGEQIELETTATEKDLGIHIDDKLNFNEHIAKSTARANKQMGLIRRTFKYIDKEIFTNLFKSRVRPILEYGNTVWHPKTKQQRDDIEAVQRRATKLVPGLKDTPYEERLQILNLPSLSFRRERGDVIEVYKYLHNKYDVQCDWLEIDHHSTTRGHNLKLKKKRSISKTRQNVFSNRVCSKWNSLPTNCVNAPSLNSFKARLDRLWKDKMFKIDQ